MERFLEWPYPRSEKTTLLQYKVDAKLGVDGSQVKIEPTGPESYRVTS